MTKKIAILSIVAFCNFSFFYLSYATAMPKAKIIKEVIDYFYNGQKEGPVLTDAKICKTIKGLNCEDTMDLNAVRAGESVKVWMQFFVPKGAVYDDIFVEYKHEGLPRYLTAHKVEGSIRYRVVDTYKPDKIGNWTITIKKGATNLKLFNVKVAKK
jgi:hypothetical protein